MAELNHVYTDLIYLLSCAVNGIAPDTARVRAMDLDMIYRVAALHSVRGCAFVALDRAGVQDKAFFDAYNKTVRRILYFDLEYQAITSDFETQGIWYMPLKGAVLKDLYPQNGMREMSDYDLLYDAAKQAQVTEIMFDHGYTAESIGKTHHDVYLKPPMLNLELHPALFGKIHAAPLKRYYADSERVLRQDENSVYGRHFSDEDFYIYITAHEWRHFSSSGTGIRSLLDCYVYCQNKGDALDWTYIGEQCRQLEISEYEQERRQLAVKIFSTEQFPMLTEKEQDLLMEYLTSGTYGTLERSTRNKLKEQSKAAYILHTLFPDVNYMKQSVDLVDKCPALYPVGLLYRWGRILVHRRNEIMTIVRVLKQHDNKKV